MSSHRASMRQVATLIMVVVSSLIGFLLAEAGYRLYLYLTEPHRFLPLLGQEAPLKFLYFQDSPYRYSAEFGYEYVPGVFYEGAIADGTVKACADSLWVINAWGNSGRIKGAYDDAARKVLVFGDSFTSQSNDGMTWPDFLQDLLEMQLGRSVHVVNFGRDGYGVLQMFDLAAAKVPEWKPDLAVIAFITDDLHRARFWRMKTVRNGQERLITALSPDPNPAWNTASDLYVINSKASREWCQQVLVSQTKGDPIVRELEAVALEARQRSTLRAHPLSLSQSFVLNLLLHRQPFYRTMTAVRPSQIPHHTLQDFAEDLRMVANVQALKATGIPYVLVHLAVYPELREGQEYLRIVDLEQDLALVDSLRRLTGQPIYGTLAHAKWPLTDLESLLIDFRVNHHPSRRGAQFYAEVVAEVLWRHGYIQ